MRSLPRLEKITLNCGLKYNNFNTKQIGPILAALESLTGQRPTITRSVKDNARLKVRSGTDFWSQSNFKRGQNVFILRTIYFNYLTKN